MEIKFTAATVIFGSGCPKKSSGAAYAAPVCTPDCYIAINIYK